MIVLLDGTTMNPTSLKLKQAAFDGDIDTLRSLVDSGADVNATDQHGSGTLLTFHPDVIAYLLSKGADPSIQTNENGASVLAGLCYVNRVECVRLLLDHGADPNHGRIESWETPLHHVLAQVGDADSTDRRELIEVLIDYDADVNAKTRPGVGSFNHWGLRTRGETPLHRAAAWASSRIVTMLLEAGADPKIQDANGELPVVWAGWHRRSKDVVELLR